MLQTCLDTLAPRLTFGHEQHILHQAGHALPATAHPLPGLVSKVVKAPAWTVNSAHGVNGLLAAQAVMGVR